VTTILVDVLAALGAVSLLGFLLIASAFAAAAMVDHPRCPAWWSEWINRHFVAPEPARSMCLPASDIADHLSDRLVRDFHVVTDDEGRDHIVPTEAPPPAERGSPPAG
jgi:hypothetical protein